MKQDMFVYMKKRCSQFCIKLPLGQHWKDEESLGHEQNLVTDTSTIDWLTVSADHFDCFPLFKLSLRTRCILLLLLAECLKVQHLSNLYKFLFYRNAGTEFWEGVRKQTYVVNL